MLLVAKAFSPQSGLHKLNPGPVSGYRVHQKLIKQFEPQKSPIHLPSDAIKGLRPGDWVKSGEVKGAEIGQINKNGSECNILLSARNYVTLRHVWDVCMREKSKAK